MERGLTSAAVLAQLHAPDNFPLHVVTCYMCMCMQNLLRVKTLQAHLMEEGEYSLNGLNVLVLPELRNSEHT